MGGAVTVGAGIQGRELLRLGQQQSPKVAVVTGECPVSQLLHWLDKTRTLLHVTEPRLTVSRL